MNTRRNAGNHPARTSRAHSKFKAQPHKGAKTSGKPGSRQPAKANVQSPEKTYTVNEAAELLSFLLTHISGRGRNAIKAILSRGQVSVNGQTTTRHNHPLQPGDSVVIGMEKPLEPLVLNGLIIVHEDEDLIVIQKEAGLLSISAGDEDEPTAYRQLMEHVRRSNPKNRIFIVHRLDRDTSGIMMFAKSERIKQQLQDNWKEAVKERSYVALVEGTVKKASGTVSSWLKETATLKMYSSQHEGDGQHAVTHYKLIQSNRHFSLLEVQLETGRKNQIRVHMADIGHPIAGDKKYGAATKTVGRLGLHARVLSFVHPTTGERLTFESPIPKTFLKYTAPTPAN